ncbi:hypothetical protein GCM10009716_25150 [Streptomyces sodiiphilus]|uniref:Gram-positive cocci surface proteins LPxTG domain-containing protein n=1 Tax=Streptomyces sodiiphilus TaxID=226217 RepID=A0ABN2P8E6_9ACTN
MRNLKLSGVLAASAAALLVGATAAPAFATPGEGWYYAGFHHEGDLPLLASDFENQEEVCADIPSDMDGWHFVTRGDAGFVKLTVTFASGDTQTLTEFGPPKDKHAYVASEAGDELVEVKGKLKGGKKEQPFNLSHTCPADVPGEEEPGEPSEEPEEPGEEPEVPGEEPETPGEEPTDVPTEEATPDGDTDEEVAGDGTELAETGSSAPVIALSAGAAALLGAGGYLVLRRRNAAQH